jgi:hypothetical protein
MLIQREDLRNRFLRLVGDRKITLTTRAMDEAGQRISRYLLTQSLINSGFGILVATALFWIGLPYAVLWGVTAALLRFVPYIGSRPRLGFKSFWTARCTIAGIEVRHAIRKGQWLTQENTPATPAE